MAPRYSGYYTHVCFCGPSSRWGVVGLCGDEWDAEH
jgi:hypothetical protein